MKDKFTLEQALAITGFTGVTACNFGLFHADVEKRLGRSVSMYEMASEAICEEIKRAYHDDFIEMCYVAPK